MAKLAAPFPSPPSRPPVHTLSFHRGDELLHSVSFGATYSALAFVNAVVSDHEIRWRGEDAFHVEDLGVTVKGDTLEFIMEYEPNKLESDFVLPEPYLRDAQRLATGERRRKRGITEGRVAHRENQQQRPKPDGLVSLASLCSELGIAPRDARAFLRKSHTKPEHGWSWTEADAVLIKKVLKSIGGGNEEEEADEAPATRAKRKTRR